VTEPTPAETCETCRFDGTQYDRRDALGTLRALTPMWATALEGLPDAVLATRPGPGRWSVVEHLDHSRVVVERVADLLERTGSSPASTVPGPPPIVPATDGDPVDLLAGLAAAHHAVHELGAALGRGTDPRWAHSVTVDGTDLDAAWLLRHAIHDSSHHLHEAGRAIHHLGAGAPSQEGTVVQLNVSDGGVPKRPVEVAEVGDRGLVGDRQAARQHHGRPLQALCLWSLEVIEALQGEGHPIAPGSAGENLTLGGIDWATLRPGTQLLVGDVLAEVSAWAEPCKKNAPWFADGDFRRMQHARHPGWSRAYAWVREPGTIRAGDPVVVEP
jgi:MOSC domain-containing protein YiiM